MAEELNGKTALVTGSGRNIGRATAIELGRLGAKVVVNSRSNEKEARSVCEEIISAGGTAIPILADVAVESEISTMFETIHKEFGPTHILINNAGLREESNISEMSNEEWERVMGVNLNGPFYCARKVVPGMIAEGWGRIINVSGLNAFKGRPGWSHVCASKMGALGLTRALSMELASHGISVNHIVPGAFDTSRDGTSPAADTSNIPVGRLGLPEEIAKTVGFLVSEGANYINGQTIHVNGGALTY